MIDFMTGGVGYKSTRWAQVIKPFTTVIYVTLDITLKLTVVTDLLDFWISFTTVRNILWASNLM